MPDYTVCVLGYSSHSCYLPSIFGFSLVTSLFPRSEEWPCNLLSLMEHDWRCHVPFQGESFKSSVLRYVGFALLPVGAEVGPPSACSVRQGCGARCPSQPACTPSLAWQEAKRSVPPRLPGKK